MNKNVRVRGIGCLTRGRMVGCFLEFRRLFRCCEMVVEVIFFTLVILNYLYAYENISQVVFFVI